MKHQLFVLNRTGHSPIAEWDPNVPVEIKSAEQVFGDLQKSGMKFFDAGEPQETKQELKTFDPEAKEIIGFGPLQAG